MEFENGKQFLEKSAADPSLWFLDPKITFLNHGSFGACPKAVIAAQFQIRERMERQPVSFFVRELEELLDRSRSILAKFVGAPARDLVFVTNATSGINTVLRSLNFRRGDEVLVTDHEYNACRNALDYAAQAAGVKTVVATLPFPLSNAAQIIEAILERLTP